MSGGGGAMTPERIEEICAQLVEGGADAEIVASMRANLLAQSAFEEGGATPAEAQDMVFVARQIQQSRKIRKALREFAGRDGGEGKR